MKAIHLSHDEMRTLYGLLESAVSDLRMEISDTDRQDFRETLKARKRNLLNVMEKLRKPETDAYT